jgi:hypothetical protein
LPYKLKILVPYQSKNKEQFIKKLVDQVINLEINRAEIELLTKNIRDKELTLIVKQYSKKYLQRAVDLQVKRINEKINGDMKIKIKDVIYENEMILLKEENGKFLYKGVISYLDKKIGNNLKYSIAMSMKK